MLDSLPDPILLDLILTSPQLRLVNRRLFQLSELLTRNRLLSYYDFSDEQIDDLAEDVRENLNLESWAAVENVAYKDYWIFGPEHVKCDINPLGSQKIAADSSDAGKPDARPLDLLKPSADSQETNGFHAIHGAPFGLHVVEWGTHCLEYTTRLRAGRYQMFLDVYIAKLAELSRARFHIVRSPTVKQYFTSVPPYQWLERQSQCVTNQCRHSDEAHSDDADDCDEFFTDELKSTKLFVGMLDVGATEASDWVDVTLRIECLDWSSSDLALILNYLYFERHRLRSSFALDWVVQHSTSDLPTLTYGLTTVYKRANERKRRWSLKEKDRAQKIAQWY